MASAMRAVLVSLSLLALLAVASCQNSSAPPPVVSPAPGDKPLNKCRVAYSQLLGTPQYNFTNITTERLCFYTCDVKNTNWYSWNQDLKACSCWLYDNVTGTQASTQGLVPTFSYFVYGNIQKCFPYCSVAVSKCKRCNVRGGGNEKPFCVFNYSKMRCCCTPPSKVVIRKGNIVGCTSSTPRKTLETDAFSPYDALEFDSADDGSLQPYTGDGEGK